jgi:hypothetical protein
MYINDSPQTPSVYLALFADDTCKYATDRKEACVLRKLQCGLSSTEAWCKRWNIEIKEERSQVINSSYRFIPCENNLASNGENVPIGNHEKHLGVIVDKRITWKLRIEMIETKAFRKFNSLYSLFKSERLSAAIK